MKTKTKGLSKISIENLVGEMTKTFEKSVTALFKKIKLSNFRGTYSKTKATKTTKAPIAEPVSSKDVVFMDVLKFIGRPALTREIASRVKSIHPEVKLSKAMLMKQLYSSASQLSKEGLINRTLVGKRMYEYSLKDGVSVAA